MDGRGYEPGVRLLGSVTLQHRDGTIVLSTSAQRRTLLALLAIRPGEVMGVHTLIDEMWGSTPPQDPRAALSVQITRLRGWLAQAAGSARSALRAQDPGYVLDIAPDRIDLIRFTQAAREADRATDPNAVMAASARALAEWHDEPFSGCVLGPVLAAEQVRHRQHHLQVLVRRAEAQLALGRPGDAVIDLAAPRRQHLTHERLTELTMIALYRTGRTREALAACHETRHHLAEHGLQPSAALQDLEHRILIADPSLLAEGPPSGPGAAPGIGRTWEPRGVGPVSDRELVEALRLSDHLGHWVETLADDDPRLPEAEVTRDALEAELRLASPRRPMMRAIVQSGLDLLRADIERFTAGLAALLDVDIADRAPIASPEVSAAVDEPDPSADRDWAASSATVTELAERAAEELPADAPVPGGDTDQSTGAPTVDDERPGRGAILVRFGRWASKEGGSALVRGGALGGAVAAGPWLARIPPAVVRLVESLLNLVGI